MTIFSSCTVFSNRIFRQSVTIYRFVRSVSRRGEPKLIKGTVKSNDVYDGDEFSNISSYDDFIRTVKSTINCNELAIESALTSEDDIAAALPKAGESGDEVGSDAYHKKIIKKKIISNKYFKMELETNLLTCAAKEQIRYLHRTNPEEWTPETLSKSFPITISGVKKLLKGNFVLKNPERIKQHDDEVEERWKALESGTASELISPYTQRMWDEGKITKQNYKSNLNLPTASSESNKTVLIENKTAKGEYSAIIQQYVNYKKEESSKIKPSEADELLVIDRNMNKFKNKNEKQLKFNKFRYRIDDETDSSDYKNYSTKYRKSRYEDEFAVPHSQFKINLSDEKNPKDFTMNPNNLKWIEDQCIDKKPALSKNPVSSDKIFTKIPKYQKQSQQSIELKTDASDSEKSFYKSRNEQIKGKMIKNRIDLPRHFKGKNTLYKVGQCVYDKNGEFLYKIPLEK